MKNQVLFRVFLLFSLSSLGFYGIAQEHSDCFDAIKLNKEHVLEIDVDTFLVADNQDHMTWDTCSRTEEFMKEFGLWYEIEIQSSGKLFFDIVPIEENDIDFVVFKAKDGDCYDLELIRCMSAGTTIGQSFEFNFPCQGPTGLKPGEIDIIEGPGCGNGSNNYLAPLNVVDGDVYYLVVLDYTALSKYPINYLLKPGGTARY